MNTATDHRLNCDERKRDGKCDRGKKMLAKIHLPIPFVIALSLIGFTRISSSLLAYDSFSIRKFFAFDADRLNLRRHRRSPTISTEPCSTIFTYCLTTNRIFIHCKVNIRRNVRIIRFVYCTQFSILMRGNATQLTLTYNIL